MDSASPAARGVPIAVVVAATVVAVGALPTLMGLNETGVPTGALYSAGWPALGLAAAMLIDSRRDARLGIVMTVLALVPVVVFVVALVAEGAPVWEGLERTWRAAGFVPVLVACAAIIAAAGFAPNRQARRRQCWLLVWTAVLLAALALAPLAVDARTTAVIMTLGLWGLSGLVVRLVTVDDLRPLDEPLVDVAAAIIPMGIGAGVGVAVGVVANRAALPAPELSAAFAAVTSAALAWPGARLVRRWWLERRYGTGVLAPSDVAAITADLHHLTDPRELLGKASDLVAACSGHRGATIVLGEDQPDVPPNWVSHSLVVGGDRVGTLLLDAADPEGPEPRQVRTVEQLVPTLALVCRAVALAIDASHAEQDVARERDAERHRVLGDLHDGLGPVLAGMSMRLQAVLRTEPTPLLESLASQLSVARTDLRRLVTDLAPAALDGTDLSAALSRLCASFDGEGRHVAVEFDGELEPPPPVAVAVYRSVAEGITNAFRHGQATHVNVRVCAADPGRVTVDVFDDGTGGPVTPGFGLTSLRRRAENLGGTLAVEGRPGSGLRLHVELPVRGAA